MIADRLCAQLGFADSGLAAAAPFGDSCSAVGALRPREEWLVLRVRRCLEDLVAAAERSGSSHPAGAARAALDGVETVMRGELLNGGIDRVAAQLPSFVFLVTLPILGQDDALALSGDTSQLVDEVLNEQLR